METCSLVSLWVTWRPAPVAGIWRGVGTVDLWVSRQIVPELSRRTPHWYPGGSREMCGMRITLSPHRRKKQGRLSYSCTALFWILTRKMCKCQYCFLEDSLWPWLLIIPISKQIIWVYLSADCRLYYNLKIKNWFLNINCFLLVLIKIKLDYWFVFY